MERGNEEDEEVPTDMGDEDMTLRDLISKGKTRGKQKESIKREQE